MKKIFFITSFLFLAIYAEAQVKGILSRSKQRAKDKANEKINNTANATVDSAFSKTERTATGVIKGKPVDKTNNNSDINSGNNPIANSTGNTIQNTDPGNLQNEEPSFVAYGKFDFVPGEKIIVLEDFSKDALGDFPDKWNTNSTGELFTVEGKPGKWLMLQKDGIFLPEFITSLPENFTLQFELMCNKEFSFYSTPLYLDIASLKSQKNFTDWKQYSYTNRNGIEILFHPTNAGFSAGSTEYKVFENGVSSLKNQTYTSQFHSRTKNSVKISVWRQKQRIRVYMNEEKVWDVPKALNASTQYNSIMFALGSSRDPKDRYYLGDIKLAVGAPDTRNKLITEGKFVSRGILFDVNSDKIKPESYGALKDIANVLSENAEVKVKIIGHTDSDGDAQSNLELSNRRAEAVKAALTQQFNIDASRMQTDGKGEAEPADKNPTAEGKANNRRVEFIKT